MGSRSATSLAIPEYAYIVLIVGIILVDVRESPWGLVVHGDVRRGCCS